MSLFGNIITLLLSLTFISYFVLIILNGKIKVTNNNTFNVTKDILKRYDMINIILTTGTFTYYNIKRKVIKLTNKVYYGNRLSDVSISLVETGISAIDNGKNKLINFFRYVFPSIKCLYLFSILAIFINVVTNSSSDAKIGIIIMIVISAIQWFIITIKNESYIWINDNISNVKFLDNSKDKILNNIKIFGVLDRIIFVSELMMIVRFVGIILNM